MDDLTPLEPEYREIPPEMPPQTPDYYGTGAQPQSNKTRLPLALSLLAVLVVVNLVAITVSLLRQAEPSKTTQQDNEPLQKVEEFSDGEEHRGGTPSPGENDSSILKGIYEHYAPGTVVITAHSDHTFECATGVILTSDGYILTDADIFANTSTLSATLYDGTTCDATLVGMDTTGDMMILKIDRRDLTTVVLDEDVSRQAMALLEEFLENTVRPATLALEISEVPRPMQIYWGLPEGVIINRLGTDTNAYRAGLRPGDVLLRIGQTSLANTGDYVEALNGYCAGETVRVYLYREGKIYYADVCLEPAQ